MTAAVSPGQGDAGQAGIVVVGSINLDLSVPVPQLPAPGETVLGGDAMWSGGGKGANQAVAAARLGRQVLMCGAVGDDAAGHEQLTNLSAEGIDTSAIAVVAEVSTGVAAIAVDPDGENTIVVSSGANAKLDAGHLPEATLADEANVVMVQFEVPLAVVAAAVEAASGMVVVNPAPAPVAPDAGERAALERIIAAAGVLVPNQGELSALLGVDAAVDQDELVAQARQLGRPVVVTLGSAGALVVEGDAVTAVAAMEVNAIDATAAGDSFCAGLADALAGGADLVEAARWATQVAAVTVTRRGAQDSLPRRDEVEASTQPG